MTPACARVPLGRFRWVSWLHRASAGACRDGLALAEALAHPFTVGIALWAAGILHQLRREPDAIARLVNE